MTIIDIAKKSGYGVGTVSRVLNNHPNVSETARKKIMQVIEEYDFVVNKNAQLLKQPSKNILILVKGTSNILLNSILEIIQKEIAKTKYTSSVFVLDEYENEALRALQFYYERRPVGIIFLGGNPQRYGSDFEKINVPCVLVTNQAGNVENENISSVGTDDQGASKEITKFLIDNGHKNIGVIGGNKDNSEITERRYLGFISAMKENSLEFDEATQYITTTYSFEGGAAAAKEFAKKANRPTAIFAMSDAMAIGAIRQFADMGIKVPEDISVVGFDGLPFTQYTCPRLTTIKQFENQLAKKGLDLLLNILEESETYSHDTVPYKLILGETVKKLN